MKLCSEDTSNVSHVACEDNFIKNRIKELKIKLPSRYMINKYGFLYSIQKANPNFKFDKEISEQIKFHFKIKE